MKQERRREMRPCTECKGTGITKGFTSEYPPYTVFPDRECVYCRGACTFEPIDESAIRTEIFSSRGARGLKKSLNGYDASSRGYYVWRLARFHGGADMTMPIAAEIRIKGDPYIEELNKLVDEVAKQAFGSDLRAAARWGKALGYF